MADIVIKSGTADTTLILSGSAARRSASHPFSENLAAIAVPALEYMTGFVKDTISISARARLLSVNADPASVRPAGEETGGKGLQRSLVRTYEEALRLYAGGSPVQAQPGIDKVSFSSESRRFAVVS